MPGFATPLSGLNAASTALSTIANNLANLNTVAYKDMRPLFRDLFYQQMGSTGAGDPIQLGVGAAVDTIDSVFTRGNIEPTGVPTDVAIMGDGFFVTEQNGVQNFTRAGNFSVSDTGTLVTADGQDVLGYTAVNGVINAGQSLASISLGQNQVSPPNATQNMKLSVNLDARVTDGTSFNSQVSVYDSLGATHVLNLKFTKTGLNQWGYDISVPAADVGKTGDPVSVKTGTLGFDNTGTLTSPSADVSGIAVSGLADGAADLSLTWNLLDKGSPVVTQLASASGTSTIYQDGFGTGTLDSFQILGDGTVQGTFTNGQTMAIAQLALATFANEQGLLRVGGNAFAPTLASGAANIGSPNSGGRGSIAGSSLELSNVDMAKEFADLIVAQRGFQANARAITTFDEITQETINLKR